MIWYQCVALEPVAVPFVLVSRAKAASIKPTLGINEYAVKKDRLYQL